MGGYEVRTRVAVVLLIEILLLALLNKGVIYWRARVGLWMCCCFDKDGASSARRLSVE